MSSEAGEAAPAAAPTTWWRGPALYYLVVVLLLVLDQATKWYVAHHLWMGVPNCYLPRPFQTTICFTYVQNTGAAFSILLGQRWGLTAIAAAVALGLIVYERQLITPRSLLQTLGLSMLLAGTLGNLIDRARFGFVIDFMDLRYQGHNIFPIFNVADMAINVGVALLVVRYLFSPSERADAALTPHDELEIRN